MSCRSPYLIRPIPLPLWSHLEQHHSERVRRNLRGTSEVQVGDDGASVMWKAVESRWHVVAERWKLDWEV